MTRFIRFVAGDQPEPDAVEKIPGADYLGVVEATSATPERRLAMDDKLRDVMTSVLAGIGSVVTYIGFADATQWASWSGAIMMVAAVVLPFMLKKPTA